MSSPCYLGFSPGSNRNTKPFTIDNLQLDPVYENKGLIIDHKLCRKPLTTYVKSKMSELLCGSPAGRVHPTYSSDLGLILAVFFFIILMKTTKSRPIIY